MEKLQSVLPAVGRLLIAAIFVWSGIGKVSDPSGTIAYIGMAGLPFPPLAYAASVIVELGGGILLILGYQTRLVAAVVAVFTLATALSFHTNFADLGQMINFMKNISMIGGLLQVVAFGAGGLSLDARRG